MKDAQRGGIFFRLLALLMLAMLVAAVYLVRHPLLRLAGGWWEVDDRPERADAIVVLGDDNFGGDRAARAAELFRGGMAPIVVASGRLLRSYAGIAELIERDLQTQGVPASAIVRFPQRAGNTREEAQALRDLVAEPGMAARPGGHLELSHAARALHFSQDLSAAGRRADHFRAGFGLRSGSLVGNASGQEAFLPGDSGLPDCRLGTVGRRRFGAGPAANPPAPSPSPVSQIKAVAVRVSTLASFWAVLGVYNFPGGRTML